MARYGQPDLAIPGHEAGPIWPFLAIPDHSWPFCNRLRDQPPRPRNGQRRLIVNLSNVRRFFEIRRICDEFRMTHRKLIEYSTSFRKFVEYSMNLRCACGGHSWAFAAGSPDRPGMSWKGQMWLAHLAILGHSVVVRGTSRQGPGMASAGPS